MSDTNKTPGQEIIEGLAELRDAIKSGAPLTRMFTVRTVDVDWQSLAPRKYDGPAVRQTRNLLGVSQAVFAKMLAVTKSTVESWEQGTRVVPAMACRLLDIVNVKRADWPDFLQESVNGAPSRIAAMSPPSRRGLSIRKATEMSRRVVTNGKRFSVKSDTRGRSSGTFVSKSRATAKAKR